MPRRALAAGPSWRAAIGALAVLAGAVACAGIITGPDAPDTRPRSMRVAPSSITVALGDTARLVASLFDATGAATTPEPGVPLTYVSSDTTVARVDGTGLVTGVGGGTVSVRGVYGALTLGVPVQVTVRPRIVVRSGAAQAAEQGDTLPAPIVVRALDAAGQPLAGVTVDFIVVSGDGAVFPASAQTDDEGDAQTRWILGTAVGTQSIRAQRTGSDSVVVTATAAAGTRVRRVSVTALRTTLATAGDTTQLLARAYNVVDSLLPAATFAWTSTDTTVLTVSATGLVTTRAAGEAYVRASSGGYADSVLLTVQPVAVTGVRHWTGAVSDAWSLAGNWLEGSPPSETDSVVIPAAGVTNLPRVEPTSIRALVSLNAGAFTIAGDGSLFVPDAFVVPSATLAATCSGGASIVLPTPTSDGQQPLAGRMACDVILQSSADRILVDSLVLLGGGLGLSNNARLTLAGHVIDLGAEQLHVSNNARLEMLDPADRVRALFANLVANDQGSMFAAGELHLRQGLAVSVGTGGFISTGTHRVVLESPAPSDTATLLVVAGVRFRDLELRMPTKLDGTFVADGDLVVATGGSLYDAPVVFSGLPQRMRVAGDVTAAAGTTTTVRLFELGGALVAPNFAPDTLALIGTGQVLPLDGSVTGLRSVRVSGTATARVAPSTRRFIAGDLVIDGDFGMAEAFTAAMGVNGSLRVIGNGILRLGGTYSSLRVEGNALFDGRAMNGELAVGDIELRGDLLQRATTSPRSLRTAAGFGLTFIGSGAIDFAAPDSSFVGTIDHFGNLTRTLRSNLTVQGIARYDLNNVVVRSDVLGAGGTRTITARGLDMGGVVTSRNVAFRVLDGAPLTLDGGPTFADFDPSVIQLDLVRSSGTTALAFATFQTVPTGAGRYLRVSDPTGAGDGAFTVNVSNVTPATHGGFAESVAPAVINGWPAGGALPRLDLDADRSHPAGLQVERILRFPSALTTGTTVTVRSLDPSRVRISMDDESLGRDSIEFLAAEGDTIVRFHLQAMEGVLGEASIIATAPGFAPDTQLVTLVRPAMSLRLVTPTSVPTAGGVDPVLQLTVGFDNEGNLEPMALRAFGPGAVFTVSSQDDERARLRFNSTDRTIGDDTTGATSVTFTLRAGRSATALPDTSFAIRASLVVERVGEAGLVGFGVSGDPAWLQIDGNPVLEIIAPQVRLTPDSIALSAAAGDTASQPRSIAVTNASLGTLDSLTADVQYGGSPSDWLSVTFDSTAAPTTMRVALAASALPPGTYLASVVVTSTTVGSLPASLSVALTVTGVARLVIVSGDSQVVAAGALAPDSLKVRLLNAAGQAVGDAFVSFTLTAGGGSLSPTSETTDVDGYVATAWTAGATPGQYTVTASRNGFQSATFTVEIVAACALGSLNVAAGPPTIEGRFCPTLANPPGAPNAQGDVSASWNETFSYGNGSYYEAMSVTYHPTTGVVREVTYFLNDPTRSILWYCSPAPAVPPCSGVSVDIATRQLTFNSTVLGQNGSLVGALTLNGTMPIAAPLIPVIGVAPDSIGFAVTAGATTAPAQTVTVSNIGPGTLNGLEASVLYGAGASDWLFASLDANMPATLTVTPLPEFLAPGSYRAIIEITSSIAGVAPETVVVTMAVTAPTTTIALDIAGEDLVGVGLSTSLDITLGAPAGAGGLTVTVTSDDPARVGVAAPGTVFIAPGQSSGAIVLNGLSAGTTTLRATAAGYTEGTLAVLATNQIISLPSTLNVPYGLTTSLPIQLATPAPAGGLTITLTSSDPSRVGVTTPTVVVPAGATLASGTLSGALPGSSTITASAPGWVSDTTLATTTLALDLFETSVSLDASFGSSATVAIRSGGSLIAAPAGGVAIDLIARNATCVNVPATVTVTAGATQVGFAVAYGGTAPTPCNTWVIAAAPNAIVDSMQVFVAVPPFLTTGDLLLGAGTQIPTSASLSSTTYGSVTLRVETLDPGLALVAANAATIGSTFIDLPVAAPTTNIGFFVAALEGVTGTARIVVSAPGFRPDTALVTVRPLGIEFLSAPTTITSFSPNFILQMRVGALSAGGTSIDAEYALRAGGTPITVTVTNSAAAVGRLVTSALTAQAVTAVIPVGSSRTPTSVASGGIEFDPLGPGSTQLTLASPGITSLANATWNTTVNAPAISVGNGLLGAGTQASWGASLGASDHGGLTVRVESSDSSLVRIAPNGSTVATGTLDVVMANGATGVPFFLAAMEGVTGTATLTVSGPGFTTATSTITVRALGIEIISAPTTTTSFSTNSLIQFRVGGMNVGGTAIDAEYPLRFGGTPITATLANSDAAAARLITSGGPTQSAQVVIPVGSSRAPTSLGTGGVDFDPLGAGTTTLTLSAPGIASLPNASWNVSISAPNASVTGATLGAGMQLSTGASLGASDHGGVTMRIESSDPSRVLIAPNATSPAVAFLDVPLANGQTSASYYLVAPEGVTGTSTITVSAPGFNSATATTTVRALGVEIISAPTTTTSLSPSSLVQARVGYLNAAGTTIEGEYPLRFNGTPITVTVTNTNATVGQLLTSTTTGQSVTTVIPVGSSRIPTSVGTGGVEFDPLSTGTTSLVISAPGILSVPNATWPITVSTPAISAGSSTLGAGMQQSTGVSLGASDYGAVTVHIESSDPSLIRVAPDGATLATGSLDIAMTAPSTSVGFHIAALEGVTGTATITISAPGFTSATYAVVVRGLGVEFISSPSSIGATAGNFLLQARVGYLNAAGTAVEGEYGLRFGGTPITLTLTNSNGAAAQLISLAGGSQLVTTTVPIGSSRVPTSIATGGVEFDPLAPGATTLNVSAPGLVALPTATRPVTVTP